MSNATTLPDPLAAGPATTPMRRKRRGGWRHKLMFFLVTRLGWLVLLLLGAGTRIRVVGRERAEKLRARYPILACIWHGRLAVPLFVHRYQRVHAMASEHRDGELIAQTLERLGYRMARGSSTHGARRASLELIHDLKPGQVAALTPDGPRGPRHQCKMGPLVIARRTGALLVPMSFSCSRKICLKSWDRFIIPLPFSNSVVVYGEALHVPADATDDDLECLRQEFERRLVAVEKEADAYFARKKAI